LLETDGSSVNRGNWLSGVSGKWLGLLRSLRMLRILLLSTGVRGVREVPDEEIESTGEEVQFTLYLVEQSRHIQELFQLVISILAHFSVPAWNQELQLKHLTAFEVTRNLHSGQNCFDFVI